jgi:hypothetical protein
VQRLYAYRNNAGYELSENQQAALTAKLRQIMGGNGASVDPTFADPAVSFTDALIADWTDRKLRTLALRLTCEGHRWRGRDGEGAIISDSDSPEDLATMTARHLAIAQEAG